MANAPAAIRKQRRAFQAQDRDAVKMHFTDQELDHEEKKAKDQFSRMDWCVKVRLISQARYALRLREAFDQVRCHHDEPCEGCDPCTIRALLGEF